MFGEDDDFMKSIAKANSNPFDTQHNPYFIQGGRAPFDDTGSPWSGSMFSMNANGNVGRTPTRGGDTGMPDGWGVPGSMLPMAGSSENVMTQQARALSQSQGGMNWMNTLMGALGRDTNKMQGAADRQYGRNAQQIGAMEAGIPHWSEQILQRMFGDTAMLGAGADQAHQQGQQFGQAQDQRTAGMLDQTEDQFAQFQKGLDPIRQGLHDQTKAGGGLDRIRGDVEEGYKIGDQAVKDMQSAMAGYEDRTAQDASVVAAGIAQRGKSMLDQAMSQLNPDGTPKTPGQMQQDRFAVQQQIGQEIQGETTKIFSEFNQNKAALGQALAGIRMNNAGLRMEGSKIGLATEQQRGQAFGQMGELSKMELGGIEGVMQARNAALDSYFKTDEGRRQWDGIAQGYRQLLSQVGQSATLASVNLEMQGRTEIARMVAENPESVVSWFQGLLGLYSTMAAATGSTGGGFTGAGTMGFGTRLS